VEPDEEGVELAFHHEGEASPAKKTTEVEVDA
jgi:hypothetical protein